MKVTKNSVFLPSIKTKELKCLTPPSHLLIRMHPTSSTLTPTLRENPSIQAQLFFIIVSSSRFHAFKIKNLTSDWINLVFQKWIFPSIMNSQNNSFECSLITRGKKSQMNFFLQITMIFLLSPTIPILLHQMITNLTTTLPITSPNSKKILNSLL